MANLLVNYRGTAEESPQFFETVESFPEQQKVDYEEESDSESVHLIRDSLKAHQLAETSFDKLLNNTSSGLQNHCFQTLAGPLPESTCYHLMILHHPNDTIWVQHIVEKLQHLEYKCCYVGQCTAHHENTHPRGTSILELEEMMLLSQKLVVLISASLVTELMYSEPGSGRDDMALWNDLDLCNFGGKDTVGLWLCADCELPPDLCKIPIVCVDDEDQSWWGQFTGWVAAAPCEEDPAKKVTPCQPEMVETSFMNFNGSVTSDHHTGSEDMLDMEVQGTSTTAGLKSGVLVSSITSKWQCCGREVFCTRLPEDFCYCQLQLSPEDFTEVVHKVNGSQRIRWHGWCFSAPCIGGGLLLLLVLCLVTVPLVEDRLIFHDSQLGFEYVHGLVMWMLILTIYLITTHFLKIKVSSDLNQRLAEVNSILVRSNIFVTLEELGIIDYSKLSLHFFYYEIGPCLGYLQDLVDPRETACNGHSSTAHNTTLQSHLTCDIDISDTAILDQDVHSQHNAEDLIVEHASHYLNCLLSGKLRTPLTPRHLDTHVCLCQFMEYRLSAKALTL